MREVTTKATIALGTDAARSAVYGMRSPKFAYYVLSLLILSQLCICRAIRICRARIYRVQCKTISTLRGADQWANDFAKLPITILAECRIPISSFSKQVRFVDEITEIYHGL